MKLSSRPLLSSITGVFLIVPLVSASPTGALADLAEGALRSMVTTARADTTEAAYEPAYIYTLNLAKRFESGAPPFVFDVRSPASFKQSHIEGALSMPYGTVDDAALAGVADLGPDSEIVTYCGCPRHLSTLAAKQLEGMGYGNVKVLYEGYWHWRDGGHPVVEGSVLTADARFRFSGTVVDESGPMTDTDVFLRHHDSGQLEATRTDAEGRFDGEFRLYDYDPSDRFDILLASLESPIIASVTGLQLERQPLRLHP